jgi:hypothetical protein
MAISSPSVINLDLNLALTTQPNVMPSVWLDVPDAHPAVPAICPNLSLTFDNRPITLHDSVLLHDSTAVAVAKGFVLPRDRALLTDKSDTDVVNDSLAFSIQCAVSTSDMARRLLVRNEEMGFLRNQIVVLQRMLKYYKQKHMELNHENIQLKKLVLSYADNLGPKIEEMENDTKRIHREYEKLQVDVHKYHASLRPSSSQVLYLNWCFLLNTPLYVLFMILLILSFLCAEIIFWNSTSAHPYDQTLMQTLFFFFFYSY